MPLTQLQFTSSLQTAAAKTLNALGTTTAPTLTQSFSLLGINLATWNQAFENVYTLFAAAPSGLAANVAAGGSLTVSTTYFYKVTAVGYASYSTTNETSGSNEASATTSSGNQTINLSWTALPGAVSYNIYRGTVTNTENVLIGNVASTVTTFSDNGTESTTSQSPPGSMPPTFVEFDLSSFTTLANEAATPGHFLGLYILPTGVVGSSQCTLAPGTSNPLTGIFSGTTPTMALRINGAFLLMGPPTGDNGLTIDSTHKTLRVTNGGSAATTVQVAAIVGP